MRTNPKAKYLDQAIFKNPGVRKVSTEGVAFSLWTNPKSLGDGNGRKGPFKGLEKIGLAERIGMCQDLGIPMGNGPCWNL